MTKKFKDVTNAELAEELARRYKEEAVAPSEEKSEREPSVPIEIRNIRVYGLNESRIAASYPKRKKSSVPNMDTVAGDSELLKKLFNVPPASGHDCATKGIVVQFDLTAPEYFWRQLDRYHFIDHVSSQSKMHSLKKFPVESMCNDQVDDIIIKHVQKLIDNGASIRKIVSNTPCGFSMTSRMTTNILQLKNIRNQRKGHKLPEWKIFIDFIDTLFAELDLIKE